MNVILKRGAVGLLMWLCLLSSSWGCDDEPIPMGELGGSVGLTEAGSGAGAGGAGGLEGSAWVAGVSAGEPMAGVAGEEPAGVEGGEGGAGEMGGAGVEGGTPVIPETSACLLAASRADYQGCSFWAIDSDNIIDADGNGPGASPSAVVVSNVSDEVAELLITDNQGAVEHQASLAPGETQSFTLSRADLIGTQLGGRAWHVTTSAPTLAYLFSPLQRTGTSSVDATLLIPTPALDDVYRALTWPGQGYNQRGTMSVIAVEEGLTTVTIVPSEESSEGVDFRGEMSSTEQRRVSPRPGEPWTAVLERGEVLNLQSGPFADLSGTLVLADQNIAVFAGTRCSNIPDQTPRCDHLEHQMLPLRNQGRSYVAPGGLPRASEQTWYRVLATVDETVISTNPPLPGTPFALSAGEVVSLSSSEPFTVNATRPVMVGMFLASANAGADGLGDPSFVLLPPVEQFKDRYVFLTPDDFERDGLTLIASGEAPISLDGVALDPSWTQVSDSRWRVAHIELNDGPHEISSAQEFAIIATGYDEEVSYAFTGGLRLEKIQSSEPPPYEGLCEGGEAPNKPCETELMGLCQAGRLSCAPGGASSCEPLLEPEPERCNQLDDDCDGLVDETGCADFNLERVSPSSDRLILTEGEPTSFSVRTQGGAIGREVLWTVDGVPFNGATSATLSWTPLGFEEGARVVRAQVRDGERVAELSWLVLVNDAPSNTPVIWGEVTRPDGTPTPGLTLQLDGGVSEGEAVIDPRGFYALPVESSTYDIKVDSLFNRYPPYPKGIVTVAEDVMVDRLNVRRDITMPISRLSGRVVTGDGSPLANTQLRFDGDCFACSQEAVSDATGAYEALLYHTTWEMNATPPEATELPTKTVNDYVLNSDALYDFIFPQVFSVTALVLDQYAQPVSGATITFEGLEAEVSRASGSDGRLTVQLPQGDYLIELDALFFPRPPQIGRGVAPIIESYNISSNIAELELHLPNAWVSGRVTRQGDGAPQAGVTVDFDSDSSCFACSGSALTDAAGDYGVPLLHGNYGISLSPPQSSGYVNQESQAIAVSADRTHNMSLLGPAVLVSGTLSDPRGARLPGVGIRTSGPTELQTTTDGSGAFELRLLPGAYRFKIDTLFGERPEGMPTGWVDIWEGSLSGDVTEDYIAPLSWVTGRVQEAAGDVIAGAQLRFNGDCFACSQDAISGPDGRYEAIVFQGEYSVDVTPPAPYPQQSIEGLDCAELDVVLDVDL